MLAILTAAAAVNGECFSIIIKLIVCKFYFDDIRGTNYTELYKLSSALQIPPAFIYLTV